MRLRQLWIAGLLCLGHQSMTGGEPPAPAQALWQQGQAALRAGEPEQAIALYEQSLEQDRTLQKNHLSLAAAYLEKGDDRAACAHLGLYLQTNPEHRNARFYHAELLLKLHQPRAARGEFERVISREQDEAEPDLKHLVHCHTRLLEVGEALDETSFAQLHRGIGLVLLARQCATLGAPSAGPSAEGLLCKAVTALTRAWTLRPDEARPCWYLHLAWRQLAQPGPARRWLAEAERHAAFAELTAAERRDLLLAAREWLDPPAAACRIQLVRD